MKIFNKIICLMYIVLLTAACSNSEYGEESDVYFPVPEIESVPDSVKVGENMIIKGKNFVEPNSVSIGGEAVTIISESPTEIVIRTPRIFKESYVEVMNVFERVVKSATEVAPIYPEANEISITKWPEIILKGNILEIEGENVDMITELLILNTLIPVVLEDQESTNLLKFFVPADLPEGNKSKIIATSVLGQTFESPELDVMNFTGSMMICDFDNFEDVDTTLLMQAPANVPYTCQNYRDGISCPQGEAFFSYYSEGATYWQNIYFTTAKMKTPINLKAFTQPYLSFRYNSDDAVGNFTLALLQGDKKWAGDFNGKTTGDELIFNMLPPTNGEWVWMNIPIDGSKDFFAYDWGSDHNPIDLKGSVNGIEIIARPFNAYHWDGTKINENFQNPYYKLNIDEICISEGPRTD